MKTVRVALLLYLISSLTVFSVALASSNSSSSNIALGPSLADSPNGPSSMRLSSHTFAFGFISLRPNSDQNKVGIWLSCVTLFDDKEADFVFKNVRDSYYHPRYNPLLAGKILTIDDNLVLERVTSVFWFHPRYDQYYEGYVWRFRWNSNAENKGGRTILKFDVDGRWVVLKVVKNFTKGEEEQEVAGRSLYKRTMDSDEISQLYGVKIGWEENYPWNTGAPIPMGAVAITEDAPCLSGRKRAMIIIVCWFLGTVAILVCLFYWCRRNC